MTLDRLSVTFATPDGPVQAVKAVGFQVAAGSVTAIVGESGSGKSVTLAALLGLLPNDAEIEGSLDIDGERFDLSRPDTVARLRGKVFGAVFQDPSASLDPVMRIGDQIAEMERAAHPRASGNERDAAIDALRRVGLNDPAARARAYPHMLSGGQKQRVAIAVALAGRPAILLADEPTTALDPTVQAQIADLLAGLVADGMSLVLVSHDLAFAAELADRIVVMYAGDVVEDGGCAEVMAAPLHPYARALAAASLDFEDGGDRTARWQGAAEGAAPIAGGCAFAPRCPDAFARCTVEVPPLVRVGDRRIACHRVSGTSS